MTGNGMVWCVPLETDRALVYAPFHGITGLVNRQTVESLRQCLGAVVSSLPVELLSFTPLLSEPNRPGKRTGRPAPLYLGLIPTGGCSLGCLYCDFPSLNKSRVMSFDTITRAIDGYAVLMRKASVREWNIHFFGGEPFSAFQEVVFALNYARMRASAAGIPVHFEVTTNGYYPGEKARWIAENFDTVVLSFDGFPESQNFQRPAPGGRGSFEIVCRNADIFARGSCELIIRSCVSSVNVSEMSRWAAFIARRFFPSAVVLEPMIESPLARKNGLKPPETAAYLHGWTAAYRILRKEGIPLVCSSGEISALKTSLCPFGQDAVIVAPDGTAGGCWQLAQNASVSGIDLRFGRVSGEGLWLDQAALDRQRSLSEANRERCRDCFCYAHCAGGCLLNHEKDSGFCLVTRALTLWQLLERMGYGTAADDLLADEAFLTLLEKTIDFSLSGRELPSGRKASRIWDEGSAPAQAEFPLDYVHIPAPPGDSRRGWIRDGSKIFLMDLDEDFVKVLEGDAAVRFLIEHSGLAPEEISVVCHALDEQAAKWRI